MDRSSCKHFVKNVSTTGKGVPQYSSVSVVLPSSILISLGEQWTAAIKPIGSILFVVCVAGGFLQTRFLFQFPPRCATVSWVSFWFFRVLTESPVHRPYRAIFQLPPVSPFFSILSIYPYQHILSSTGHGQFGRHVPLKYDVLCCKRRKKRAKVNWRDRKKRAHRERKVKSKW